MHHIYKYGLILFIFFGFTACDLTKRLPLPNTKGVDFPVIYADFIARTTQNKHRYKDVYSVYIFKTAPLSQSFDPSTLASLLLISNAVITLSDDQGNTVQIPYVSSKFGYYLENDPFLTAGTTYTLNVRWNGNTYTASSTLQALNTNISDFKIVESPQNQNDTEKKIEITLNRPPDSYYEIQNYEFFGLGTPNSPINLITGEIKNSETNIVIPTEDGIGISVGNVSILLDMEEDQNLSHQGSIEVGSIDYPTYKYKLQTKQIDMLGGSGITMLLGIIPYNPASNWKSSIKGEEVIGNFSLKNIYQFNYRYNATNNILTPFIQ